MRKNLVLRLVLLIPMSWAMVGCQDDIGVVEESDIIGNYIESTSHSRVELSLLKGGTAQLYKECLEEPKCKIAAVGSWKLLERVPNF